MTKVLIFLFILLFGISIEEREGLGAVSKEVCTELNITDFLFVGCFDPHLYSDNSNLFSSSESMIQHDSVSNPKNKQHGIDLPVKLSNTTFSKSNLFTSLLVCTIKDKEVEIRRSIQKCFSPRSVYRNPKRKEDKDDSILSPYNPPVWVSEFLNYVIADHEDNFFEGIRPAFPISLSEKSVKQRINFASSKAGAIAIAKSKGMSGNSDLLTSNKYKYAISSCKINKWFIFSLAEMTLVDSIAVGNYERFSSSVRQFVIYGSTVYPTVSWKVLGYFEALEKSSLQVFSISTPIWTKFMKIEWLSWYGNEAMCTMSEIRVFGSNMASTMLQTDFSTNDSRSAGLKEIIANEVQDTPPLDEQIQEELKETKAASSETSTLLVSPEFKPLYEMFRRCEEDQAEITFSVALLSNKTKQKIHSLKERIKLVENQTVWLFDEYQDQQNRLEELETSIHSYSSIIHDIQIHYRYCRIWLIVGLLVIVWIGSKLKKQLKRQQIQLKRNEKKLEIMEKWVEDLQKQILLASMEQEEIKVKKEPSVQVNEKKKKGRKHV